MRLVPLQRRLLELRLDTILDSKVRHQVTRQELAGPRLPQLRLQIIDRKLNVLLLHTSDNGLDGRSDLVDEVVDVLSGNKLPGIVNAKSILHPLPELDTSNLGGSSVLHEVVEGDASIASDPGGGVSEAAGHVLLDTLQSNLARDLRVQQVGSGNLDLGPKVVVLVRSEHMFVEYLASDLVDERMGDPGSVVASGDFTQLVRSDLGHGNLVGLGVVLDGDLSGHAAHRSNLALVAGLDEEPDVGVHEGNGHRNVLAVREDGGTIRTALLDEAEDVVPSKCIYEKLVLEQAEMKAAYRPQFNPLE